MDPLKNGINLNIGYVLYFARQYEAALDQYNIGVGLDPAYGAAYYGRGLVNAAIGRYKDAIADYKEMIRLYKDHAGVNCYLGAALAKDGQIDAARDILRRLETGKEYVSRVELAVLYTALGETDKALSAVERAFNERDPQMQYLTVEPNFDPIKQEPRFRELIRKVGLPI